MPIRLGILFIACYKSVLFANLFFFLKRKEYTSTPASTDFIFFQQF